MATDPKIQHKINKLLEDQLLIDNAIQKLAEKGKWHSDKILQAYEQRVQVARELSKIEDDIAEDVEIEVDFLKRGNFTFVLGLRNVEFKDNPSPKWIDKLKEILKSNEIDYDEYIIDRYPTPIPEFDIPENVFILRYSFDPYNKIDKFASNQFLFEEFIKKSDLEEYYKEIEDGDRMRVIVFCSDIENIILQESFNK